MDALPENVRDRLLSLGSRWEVPGLFTGRLEAIVASLEKQVGDSAADDGARAAAASRWIALDDRTEVADSILTQISLLPSPSLAAGFVNALSDSRTNETGRVITNHWPTFTPAVRRAAIGVLLRRSAWALALLEAIQEKSVDPADVAPEYWVQLRRNRDRRVAGRANSLADTEIGRASCRERG